jgi:N-acetylglucosamine-6-sulfatase
MAFAGCSGDGDTGSASPTSTAPSTTATSSRAGTAGSRPNIVVILTDDLSWNLVDQRIAPHIVALQKRGATFDHYVVADSLCCPSRSTILTGLFPHDTHVVTNVPPDGGYQKFQSEALDRRTFAVGLHENGYATSMLGKYLNGYGDPGDAGGTKVKTPKRDRAAPDGAAFPVPPGWSDWHVANGTGYAEFNFWQSDGGTFHFYGGRKDYGVDVINSEAQSFIHQHASTPFLVEASTFAPHRPYTPAPRNADDFPDLTQLHDASFDAENTNPPAWLGQRPALTPTQIAVTDAAYRKRAQSVEAVDKLLADTEATLAREHLLDRTYIFFTSDNGYHLGQHRLRVGKQTAFDTDIRVPLVVAGPGIPAGRVVPQVAQNVDLDPTFLDLAGVTPKGSVEGRSLVPLLRSDPAPRWRTAALVEHKGGNTAPTDPDFEAAGTLPTTYEAIRISAPHLPQFDGPVEAVYVEYQDPQHELEYYDIAKDPNELDNTVRTLTDAQRKTLHELVAGLRNCHDGRSCWTAGRPQPPS